ncbi:hypothetical protein [Nocardia pseudovaccinii]|uniref:hypothetical protein n=1 Tax=Nocardia pseudovaccinii TaxID=189540 RepID=UPI0007A4F30A|nr:hypothetical protein [Nocardia pseudovaccinii]
MPQHNPTPDRAVVDEIDTLVDEQLATAPDSGVREVCPHCGDEWHSLPIRKTLLMIRQLYCGCEDCERILDAYDYASDTSPIICPGSTFHGPVEPLELRAARAGVIVIDIATLLREPPTQTPVPPAPTPPDGCALRLRFPAADAYQGPVWAYRLSRPWRDTDYVVVMHVQRHTDTGPTTISETALFRYFPPGTPQPPSRESFFVGGELLAIIDDSDAEGGHAAIDSHGVNIEVGDHGARHRADGHVNPDLFVQQITGQMVVVIVE